MKDFNFSTDKPTILFVGSFIDENVKKERGGMLRDCGYLINSDVATKANFIKFDSTNETIPIPPLTKRMIKSIQRIFKFIDALSLNKPNIVLIYSSGGLSFIEKGLLTILSKYFKTPVIWSIRSGVFMDQIKHSKLFAIISKFLLSFSDIILCQGTSWEKFYINYLDIKQDKLKTILNWIEPTPFLPISPELAKNPKNENFNLLFVGWVNRAKGIFELLDVVSEIANSKIKIRLDVVGKGENFEEAVKTAIASKQYNQTIFFHEWLDGEALLESFKNADALVLPTYAEGFPNVILEAMACGLPVITTPVGSIPDVISDGKNGLLIQPKDRSALKDAILHLRDNSQLRIEMGSLNKNQILKNHDIKNLSEQFWEIISNLTKESIKLESKKIKMLFIGSFIEQSKRIEKGGILASCTYLLNSRLNGLVDFILLDSTNESIPPPSIVTRFINAIKRFTKLIKILIFNKPDVALIYSSAGLSFIEKSILSLVTKIFFTPVILSIRSGIFLDQINESKIFMLISKFLLCFPDILICQGNTAAEAYKKTLQIKNEKIEVIPNWIEASKFLEIPERKLKNFSQEGLNILFVGWISKVKGIFELIDAASKLTNDNINVKLHIVGGGADFKEAVNYAGKIISLNHSIYFHEWLSGASLIEQFKQADIFVLPSYAEGFPNVILEAMAAGLPIITTPVGSITDVIKNGRNGLIVEPKNRNQLIEAILYLRKNPQICLDMSKINRIQVLENHGMDKLSNQLWEIIKSKCL